MRLGRQAGKVSSGPRFRQQLTIVKQAPGTRGSNGRYTPGATSSTTVQGNFQPATPAQRSILPENERILQVYMVTIQTEDTDLLRPVRVGTPQTQADVIQAEGLDYTVRNVDNFSRHGHVEAIVVRREGQDG